MPLEIALNYFSKLLNKPIGKEEYVALSSAQKARVHSWLIKANIPFNESLLSQKFSVEQLLGGYGDSVKSVQQKLPNDILQSRAHEEVSRQIGIDIQRVDELFPRGLSSDPKSDQFLTEIFTLKELSYAQSKENPEITLAGIFSAKEAIQKTSNTQRALYEIEILPDASGRPTSKGYAVSISHSGNYAVGVAVGESKFLDGLNELSAEDIYMSKRLGRGFEFVENKTLKFRVMDALFVLLFLILFLMFYYH